MPYRTARPCRAPGCPNLVRGKGSLCPAHKKAETARYNASRGSSTERGYGADWQRIRDAFIRDNPWCSDPFGVHLAPGHAEPATFVDHILPKTQGGTDEASNLASMCRSCHSRKSALEGSRWPKR